jgi:hypothetical protein
LYSWKKIVKGTGVGEVVALFCPFALSIYQTLSKFLLQRTAECVQTYEQSTGKERGVSGSFSDYVGDYVILRLCPGLADNSQEQWITVAPFNVEVWVSNPGVRRKSNLLYPTRVSQF